MQYNNCFFIVISATELIVEFFLDASAPPLGMRATLNPLCAEPPSNLFVQGLFGVRQAPNKECIYLQSSTQSFADSDTVFIELNLALPVGVVICLGVAWYGKRHGQGPSIHSEGDQHKSQQVQEAIYEEPPETAIPLSDNQAYGHFDTQRKN